MKRLFLTSILLLPMPMLAATTPHIQVKIASFTLSAETTNQPVRLEPNRTLAAVAIQRGVTDTAGQITFSNMPGGQYTLFLPQSGVPQLTLEVPETEGVLQASTLVTTPGWTSPAPSAAVPIPPNLFRGVPYLWPSAQGASGTVLENDGSGNLTWSSNHFYLVSENRYGLGTFFTAGFLFADLNNNIAIGADAMEDPTGDASANVFIGTGAGEELTDGDSNVGIGLAALGSVTTGNENLAVGRQAGANITTGDYNTLLGNFTFSAADRQNSTAIGHSAEITADNQMVFGEGVTIYRFRDVNYTFPASQGVQYTVMTNDGAGNLGWARVGGVYSDNSAYTNLNAAGTMSNLASVTIAGNTLTNTGDAFYGEAEGRLRNTFVSTNQFQWVFGSQTILDTGAQAVSNMTFNGWCRVRRLAGTDAQRAYAHFEWGPGGGVPFAFTNATVDLVQTNGIDTVFALKGGAFGLGSHTNNSFQLEIKRAP